MNLAACWLMTKSLMKPMTGSVAVVAGATRGAGRGIARALGEAGAIVYCTGRSVRGNPSAYQRPETIEETAEMITAAGGSAVSVRVDHTQVIGTCMSCHNGTKATGKPANHPVTPGSCDNCHTTIAWTPAK